MDISKVKLGLWEEFRNKRMEMNLEQKMLGKMLDVSATTICNWENGIYKVSQKYADKLKRLMNINIPSERTKQGSSRVFNTRRAISWDDIDTILWLYRKGYDAKSIAKELNRDMNDIESVLIKSAKLIS